MRTKLLIFLLLLSCLAASAQKIDTTGLQPDIKVLLKASAAYLEKNTKGEAGWETYLSRTEKSIAILTSLLALFTSILAFYKKDFLSKYKGIIAIVGIVSFSALLSFLFAGLLQTVVLAFLAITIALFLFLYLALRYIDLLEGKGYKIVDRLGSYLSLEKQENTEESFISGLLEWLDKVKSSQIKHENFNLLLKGSFINDHPFTRFLLIPTDTGESRYLVLAGKVLVPTHIEIRFQKTSDQAADYLLLKNIQGNNLVVTATQSGGLAYHSFNLQGFEDLLVDFEVGPWRTESKSPAPQY